MRLTPIAALSLLAALALAGPAPAQDRDQLFVNGSLSGAIGPDLGSSAAVRRAQRSLGEAMTAYAETQFGKLTATDREQHDAAAATALWLTPGTSPVAWRNFRTRLRGVVTPEVGVFRLGGAVCRNYAERFVTQQQVETQFQAVVCFDRSNNSWVVWPRPQDAPGG